MCLGVPMQVRESHAGYALCEHAGTMRRIDTLLVGDQPVGAWLLVFIDAAREVISSDEAARIGNALSALDNVMKGEAADIDAMFADIIEAAAERDQQESQNQSDTE
ncbi:MAG: HypC/HybG/HupF family hydrogenase formation chaperone [Parvularcula sp.]